MKRGRPATGRKRDKQLILRLAEDEIHMIDEVMRHYNMSRREVLMRWVEEKYENIYRNFNPLDYYDDSYNYDMDTRFDEKYW